MIQLAQCTCLTAGMHPANANPTYHLGYSWLQCRLAAIFDIAEGDPGVRRVRKVSQTLSGGTAATPTCSSLNPPTLHLTDLPQSRDCASALPPDHVPAEQFAESWVKACWPLVPLHHQIWRLGYTISETESLSSFGLHPLAAGSNSIFPRQELTLWQGTGKLQVGSHQPTQQPLYGSTGPIEVGGGGFASFEDTV